MIVIKKSLFNRFQTNGIFHKAIYDKVRIGLATERG